MQTISPTLWWMVLLSSMALLAGCGGDETTAPAPDPPPYTDLTAEEALALIESGNRLVIVDVSAAYPEGHIPAAVHYPIGDGSLTAALGELDRQAVYLVYGHQDAEADRAARMLAGAGIDTIYRLEGNFAAWQDAAYDIEVGAFTYVDLSLADAHGRISANDRLLVLDVSSQANYFTWHIPGAVNYSGPDGTFDAYFIFLERGREYLVYGADLDGTDARVAARKMVDAGFQYVYRLRGNMSDWVVAGYEFVAGAT